MLRLARRRFSSDSTAVSMDIHKYLADFIWKWLPQQVSDFFKPWPAPSLQNMDLRCSNADKTRNPLMVCGFRGWIHSHSYSHPT